MQGLIEQNLERKKRHGFIPQTPQVSGNSSSNAKLFILGVFKLSQLVAFRDS